MSRYATDARLRLSINIMPASFQGRQSIKKSKNQKRSLIPQNRSNRQLAHCILVNTHDFFCPARESNPGHRCLQTHSHQLSQGSSQI